MMRWVSSVAYSTALLDALPWLPPRWGLGGSSAQAELARVGADGPLGGCRCSGHFVRHLPANKVKERQNTVFCEL